MGTGGLQARPVEIGEPHTLVSQGDADKLPGVEPEPVRTQDELEVLRGQVLDQFVRADLGVEDLECLVLDRRVVGAEIDHGVSPCLVDAVSSGVVHACLVACVRHGVSLEDDCEDDDRDGDQCGGLQDLRGGSW